MTAPKMDLLAQRKTCPNCGASLDLDIVSGFCPGCLLNTVFETERDLAPGSRIEDYELLSEVARGGMGIVYRARQRAPSRVVALKMILPAHLNSLGAINRFRAEAEAAASLEHDGILPIYAVGEHDGAPFYSMKFAEGGTLSARIDNYRDKPRQAAALVAKLVRAVAFAHEHGILHRDLKPGNVLFDSADKPYVSDFGLAKWLQRECDLTQTLAILGTPYYMAPEQATDSRGVTAAADVYSLGAILYHLLAGRPPIWGETPMEVLHRAASEKPKSPRLTNGRVSRDLETICLKCLEKEPPARYVSAAALADDLERFCAGHTIQARPVGLANRAWRWSRRNPGLAALSAATLVLLIVIAALVPLRRETMQPVPTEKAVAVLPLENLSEEKENAYFASGIQDELLSNLAKIKDLKVISRTSVMQYKSGTTRNLKEIAKQLGVSHVVEGSVRRSGNRIRVSVQLIDAQTDHHIWVQNYDRTLADSITLQDELATEIAGALGATLSPQEKARVEAKPTNNPAAYDAYLRGRAFEGGSPFDKSTVESVIQSYQEAVKLDPAFALAWARLSCAQSGSYWNGHDPSPAQLAAAKDAADHALALDPNLPETHLALGYYRYYGQRDYTGGLAEFQQAEQGLPNNVDITNAIALIQRRLGHWEEAIDRLRRVVELDPRNTNAYNTLAMTYSALRRFPEALATVDRVLAWEPTNKEALSWKANALWATGDLQAVEALLGKNPSIDPGERGVQASFQRRYATAIEIFSSEVAAATECDWPCIGGKFALAVNQQHAGDVAAARATYQSLADDIQRYLEKIAPDSPQAARTHVALGLAYAGLGEAASAIAEGQKAMAMLPPSKDPFDGPAIEENMALIYALLGDADHAIPILRQLLHTPYGGGAILSESGVPITPASLRLDPEWDQIRNDPRFQELAAEKKP